MKMIHVAFIALLAALLAFAACSSGKNTNTVDPGAEALTAPKTMEQPVADNPAADQPVDDLVEDELADDESDNEPVADDMGDDMGTDDNIASDELGDEEPPVFDDGDIEPEGEEPME